MAAQPKRKITRARQGKRRRGNTPYLQKQLAHSAVARHKKGFFDKMIAWATGKPMATEEKETKKAAAKAGQAEVKTDARMAAKPTAVTGAVKKVTRTQHKGG